jgi:hypothetical protein
MPADESPQERVVRFIFQFERFDVFRRLGPATTRAPRSRRRLQPCASKHLKAGTSLTWSEPPPARKA